MPSVCFELKMDRLMAAHLIVNIHYALFTTVIELVRPVVSDRRGMAASFRCPRARQCGNAIRRTPEDQTSS